MRNRILATIGIPLIVAELLVSIPAAAQAPAGSRATSTGKAAAAKKWRTPWGDPDLQGSWSNSTTTPLERPAKFAGREFMTAQELAEQRAQEQAARNKNDEPGQAPTGFAWYEPDVLEGRTSLIYDPPDGRMPALTPEGQKRQAELNAIYQRGRNNGPFDGPEDAELRTRCVIRDALPRIPGAYGNSYEIVQAPGSVAIYHEAIHDTRIVPLDGRPHLDQSVRQWFGDPRGHWEGDTLVVETTNFNDQTSFQASTQNLHLVERWTRTADDRIDYSFTVSDPATWTKPWSAAIFWTKIGPLYEYACHEDNIDMYGILTGARANDQKTSDEPN
jgi:hypothetical protein